MPRVAAGDWPLADIFQRWPPRMAVRLASYHWPLSTLEEARRLIDDPVLDIQDLIVCEFTAATREANQRLHGVLTLSVDLRASRVPGPHACVDARVIVPLRPRWRRVYAFPPCTHQTLSDTISRRFKEQDGRMFWGILFVLWCYCIAVSLMMMVEQPATVIPRLIMEPSQRFRTGQMNDCIDKEVNLFERGRAPVAIKRQSGGVSGHGNLHDFADAEERDRQRSDWSRFPNTVDVLVGAELRPCADVSFEELREQFAVAWYRHGLPVPHDYESPNAAPSEEGARRYQETRGRGDGRQVDAVIPRSLRTSEDARSPDSIRPEAVLARVISLHDATAYSFILCFVVMQAMPLVLAPLNGIDVIGAHLYEPTQRRSAVAIASQWADVAISATSSTFLVGEYDGGARLIASPIDFQPHTRQIARTAADRRRLQRAGLLAGWCSLAALAGSAAYDPAARVMAACAALRAPVEWMADAPFFQHERLTSFTIGTFASRPMVDRLADLPVSTAPFELTLARVRHTARDLVRRLRAQGDEESHFWADVVRPEELQDIPQSLLHNLPSFEDPRLDRYSLATPYSPPRSERLQQRPQQPPLPLGVCYRHPVEAMLPPTRARFLRWMNLTLTDLVCVRDLGVDCERRRPPVLTIAQSEIDPPARGYVLDFRASPAACAVPLDYTRSPERTLDAAFFRRELHDYPNQRILGMIEDGASYQADVELHAVFVPHLTSLPKGFTAVNKELKRLKDKGWYEYFPHLPFFPGYFNGQGSQSRKLEANRDRRTTEGGGPRRETFDADGLRVLSINAASKIFHIPRHYQLDPRPEMQAWMASRGLPPTPELLAAAAANHGSKQAPQYMPTLRMVMHDLAVLSRRAHRLGLPIYVFGNDVKDYFNHLTNAAADLPLMNIAWIDADDLEADARQRAYSDGRGNRLVFVSEKRMGFGIHPNSGIAQELSEAVDFIFRRRMDAFADPLLRRDTRSVVQEWLRERLAVEQRTGVHERRLYACHTYCDDNIVIVVGVDQALGAISIRRQIEQEAGLIMAIPAKRMLGTWCTWLGIYIFAALGVCVVPRPKLVRATSALRRTLGRRLQFDDYQALMGLLEHIRHAACWPRSLMHGLYRPHGPDGEGRQGPATIVQPTLFMARQLSRWLVQLTLSAGSAVTAALRRARLPPGDGPSLRYVASSDAATDSDPPGMGGYMHGLYWYIALTAEHVAWLHITVLELLATGFSAIIFRAELPPTAELALQTDSAATATSLTLHSQRSPALVRAHQRLLDDPDFADAQKYSSLGHLSGDGNEASDSVSRAKWETFAALVRRAGARPRRLPVPQRCHDILTQTLADARLLGVPVRVNNYRASEPSVPTEHRLRPQHDQRADASTDATLAQRPLAPTEQHLGKRCRNCADGDGPGKYAAACAASKAQVRLGSETCEPDAPRMSALALARQRMAVKQETATLSRQEAPPFLPRQSALARARSQRPASSTQRADSQRADRTAGSRAGPKRRLSTEDEEAAMPYTLIGGQRFAVPHERQARALSKRKRAMLAVAHARADRLARPDAPEDERLNLAAAVTVAHELAEHGAAFGTLDKDDLAYEYWARFCQLYGWSPTFNEDFEWVRTHHEEISQRLAIFQAWVYPQLKGRGGRADAKPRSVFNNYVLAVIRTLSREHYSMPKAKHIEKNLAGLSRSFKNIYGVDHLMPGHKQPLTPDMWSRIEGLPDGADLPGRAAWSPETRHRDRTILRLGRVLWRTGHRLGEIVWHPSGEINYLTRKSVSISKADGRKVSQPTAADWRQLQPGDSVLLAPCASKSDQFGEEHCPFPSILPCDANSSSAAYAIRDIELETPCVAADRHRTPLFADANGAPFTYAVLHAELRKLLAALYGAKRAAAYSWHSFRIGLACALHAADCPDAVIQLICRWANPASLKVYRQMGIEKNIYWTERAQHVVFDATRVNNIPALDNDDVTAHNLGAFDEPGTVARPATTVDTTAYPIPGGTVLAVQLDANGLVGQHVDILNNFWGGYEDDYGKTNCQVAARCVREFCHPDRTRCLTYLISYGDLFYPIKHSALLSCMSAQQRANLPQQQGF